MIERELARLRFLNTRAIKGERLLPEDISFILDKKAEISTILDGIQETLDIIRTKEEEL